MEVKIVENAKDIQCDALIINKFEGENTSMDLVNKYAPEDFTGKCGQVFSIHTRNEYPAKQIIAVGFGKRENIDNNIVRENIAKAINKKNYYKRK